MFSSDQNIETIGELVEALKQYGTLHLEKAKFDLIDKIVKIITALSLTLVLSLLVVLMLIYLSFAAAYALASLTDSMVVGFLIIAAVYLAIFLLVLAERKTWIERPLVKFLANILLDQQ